MVYQHAARGADAAITHAIDAHIDAQQSADEDGGDGSSGALVPAGQWHVNGTTGRQVTADTGRMRETEGADLGFLVGAGEGNRTLMTSLEGWGSAIELRPHVWRGDEVPAR
jgi:hypothetical protein